MVNMSGVSVNMMLAEDSERTVIMRANDHDSRDGGTTNTTPYNTPIRDATCNCHRAHQNHHIRYLQKMYML
jgi:hypothetical protein